MRKLKNLNKKLRRLEARMQKDAKKFSKLKRKVESAVKADSVRTKRKSADPAKKAPETAQTTARPPKKKLNLTPERRAQLSAAMKARWAAKRAATATNAVPTEGPHDSRP